MSPNQNESYDFLAIQHFDSELISLRRYQETLEQIVISFPSR